MIKLLFESSPQPLCHHWAFVDETGDSYDVFAIYGAGAAMDAALLVMFETPTGAIERYGLQELGDFDAPCAEAALAAATRYLAAHPRPVPLDRPTAWERVLRDG